jgi:hypothetical protein
MSGSCMLDFFAGPDMLPDRLNDMLKMEETAA